MVWKYRKKEHKISVHVIVSMLRSYITVQMRIIFQVNEEFIKLKINKENETQNIWIHGTIHCWFFLKRKKNSFLSRRE